ncbi:Synaptobrevin [Spironucleus salmonicida]|uniref:Synaptobrevin n=1 Tax=Spironucleus salmonicida TaxID=348837 RepID=S5TUT6_9EUKA|nr:synaptobrevin [Spironucleus salmonicida]KAH0575728.1 Synaptobrevin [Spironucleus salmonicida]|eukprot:EST47239.1 Synaptobrevin [Spironucleus salmonicida]
MDVSNINLLKKETESIKKQATDNLEKLYTRGIELDGLADNAKDLQDTTKQILSDAKELDWAAFWRKYQIWIIVWGVIIIFTIEKLIF